MFDAITYALAKAFTKKAIEDVEAGSMRVEDYDSEGNGVVNDSRKLGGNLPSYYASTASIIGKMDKSVYDSNDNGIVDNAEKVNGHTVASDVPANAQFTDTKKLADMTDTDFNDLVDGEAVVWDGINEKFINRVIQGGTTIVQIPSVVIGTYTYNGSTQSPTITGLDTTHCDVTGTSESVNAGDFTFTISLKDPTSMVWSDMTIADRTFTWSIAKADGAATLSKNTVELDSETLSDTVTISGATGDITITSSDTTVATVTPASMSAPGGSVTISSVNDTNGSASVIINVSETQNYKPIAINVTVNCSFSIIYGVEWDGTSTTRWERTDNAKNFVDPVPYIAGATNYSSPFDNIMPWSGMVKEQRTGGTMVKIPKFWYKLTQNGAGLKIQISNEEVEGFSVSPAHIDRGDGEGERDFVYVGRYHCGSSTKKSKTGETPYTCQKFSTMNGDIQGLGTNIWMFDFLTLFTIWLLYLVEFADWNSQNKIGYGCEDTSTTLPNNGYTDSMPYHTGTTKSSRTVYGAGVQYRNIEGLWDNVSEWLYGITGYTSLLRISLKPTNSNTYSMGSTASGFPTEFEVVTVSAPNRFQVFKPKTSGGANTTYSCDNWYASSSSSTGLAMRNPFSYGGNGANLSKGLFNLSIGAGNTYSDSLLGCRLMELP